jgi:hypothetical protein
MLCAPCDRSGRSAWPEAAPGLTPGPIQQKIGSADRVEVHHARLLAVIGVRKPFPHGLGQTRTWRPRNSTSAVPPKADSSRTSGHVRLVPNSDIPRQLNSGDFRRGPHDWTFAVDTNQCMIFKGVLYLKMRRLSSLWGHLTRRRTQCASASSRRLSVPLSA